MCEITPCRKDHRRHVGCMRFSATPDPTIRMPTGSMPCVRPPAAKKGIAPHSPLSCTGRQGNGNVQPAFNFSLPNADCSSGDRAATIELIRKHSPTKWLLSQNVIAFNLYTTTPPLTPFPQVILSGVRLGSQLQNASPDRTDMAPEARRAT